LPPEFALKCQGKDASARVQVLQSKRSRGLGLEFEFQVRARDLGMGSKFGTPYPDPGRGIRARVKYRISLVGLTPRSVVRDTEADQYVPKCFGPRVPSSRAADAATAIVPAAALDERPRVARGLAVHSNTCPAASCSPKGLAPSGNRPTGTVSNGPASWLLSRLGSNRSPQGKRCPSTPRAAFSHSCSVGIRHLMPVRDDSHCAYALASSYEISTTGCICRPLGARPSTHACRRVRL
jgi:hypothetical protein